MKTTNVSFLILMGIAGMFFQAATAQNAHKWKYAAKHLSIEEVYLSLDGEPYLKDEFPLGSTAKFAFDGIAGYRLTDNKAFPRLAMVVRENIPNGEVILQFDNLLKEYEATGVEPSQAATLSARLSMGKPLVEGGKYTWELIIIDAKGKGKISLNYDFEVTAAKAVPEDKKFIFHPNNLEAEGVELEMDGQPYALTDLPYLKTIDMVFQGIRGLMEKNGKVFPGLAIKVIDTKGNLILLESDLLAQFNQEGLTPEQANRLVSTLTIGNPMQLGGQYTWEVRIWDKIWPKGTIDSVLHFEVIE